jgi:hypothetical protein
VGRGLHGDLPTATVHRLLATLAQWRLDRIAARETVLESMKSLDKLGKRVRELEDECENWRQAHRRKMLEI